MADVGSRQVFPDRLRGIALLGIVVVNAPPLGISVDGFTASSLEGVWNAAAAFLVVVLAQGKFYLLFSFLFGYSASFILRDGSGPNRRRYARRLVGLAIIGVVHAVFFYLGDILMTYAVLGFGLLALSSRSDRTLRRWAVAAVVVGVLLPFVMIGPLADLDPNALTAPTNPTLAALDAALADGSFLTAALARVQTLPLALAALFVQQGPMAFSAFCLGLLAARHRLLADPARRRAQWRRLAVFGVVIGLPIQVVAGAMALFHFGGESSQPTVAALGTALIFVTAPILTVGYLGLLGWGLALWPRLLAFAATPGRASLTVYIGESVLLSLLFCGYGLGYFGQWGALPVVISGIVAWVVLALLARVWLGRFAQGPLEVLLARWTGKRKLLARVEVR
ncbi:MAG: uncharacterized protein QG597_2996 [Actinomycetota bacterium]|nr:uncharacterized protein [Actinomycetota bacterium]